MRVAVVDIGTNSTRLLLADVGPDGSVTELLRQSRVTRLGAGVDAHGGLSPAAVERTCAVLADYRALIDRHGCAANLAVLTSAVRDASDGAAFAERVRRDYRLDARTLSGDEEAALTFLGAMSEREASSEPTVVVDIGGGSTEFVVGHDHTAGFHVSLQAGVVRMSERHIQSDPPAPTELQRLALDTRSIYLDGLPPRSAPRYGMGSLSPAPLLRRPRSIWSLIPTTPHASTGTCCCSPRSSCYSPASPA